MNKSDLVVQVAAKTKLTINASEEAVNATFDEIEGAMADGEKDAIHGFGTFEVRSRASSTGRNPQTGETIAIPAGVAPAFKPSKQLKGAVKK